MNSDHESQNCLTCRLIRVMTDHGFRSDEQWKGVTIRIRNDMKLVTLIKKWTWYLTTFIHVRLHVRPRPFTRLYMPVYARTCPYIARIWILTYFFTYVLISAKVCASLMQWSGKTMLIYIYTHYMGNPHTCFDQSPPSALLLWKGATSLPILLYRGLWALLCF